VPVVSPTVPCGGANECFAPAPPPPPPPPSPCGYGAIQCATPPPPGGQLPFTGLEVWAFAGLAVALVALGLIIRLSERIR
jgi:hypothetical protein